MTLQRNTPKASKRMREDIDPDEDYDVFITKRRVPASLIFKKYKGWFISCLVASAVIGVLVIIQGTRMNIKTNVVAKTVGAEAETEELRLGWFNSQWAARNAVKNIAASCDSFEKPDSWECAVTHVSSPEPNKFVVSGNFSYPRQEENSAAMDLKIKSAVIEPCVALVGNDGALNGRFHVSVVNKTGQELSTSVCDQEKLKDFLASSSLGAHSSSDDSKGIAKGTYEVGTDIPAGEYVIIGEGYLAVTFDNSGSFDSIVTNDNYKNRTIISVSDKQYLEFDGVAYAAEDAPTIDIAQGPLPEGKYKVGVDFPAGAYALTPDNDGHYEISSSSDGSAQSVIIGDNFTQEVHVSVTDGQYLKIKRAAVKPLP